jgi:hypothetical protein
MNAKELLVYLDTTLPQSGDSIKQAMIDVLLNGLTWRQAAITNQVTESGILKAMQRSKVKEFMQAFCKLDSCIVTSNFF